MNVRGTAGAQDQALGNTSTKAEQAGRSGWGTSGRREPGAPARPMSGRVCCQAPQQQEDRGVALVQWQAGAGPWPWWGQVRVGFGGEQRVRDGGRSGGDVSKPVTEGWEGLSGQGCVLTSGWMEPVVQPHRGK